MIQTVAIYIRLSLEDTEVVTDTKIESESITNQRTMLIDYIKHSQELSEADIIEFCDDGYSGKNFDRPGVTELINAARNSSIQCIVCKDLSRFGRDYIAVGNYISRVFPFLGVRFIAVNDNFDSSRKGDIDSLDTSFKTLIYDMYSRDLSKKVLSAKKNLVERGVYINPVAPYGYRKDPNDKHRLVIDPEAGKIVQRIFTLYADGTVARDIALTLNNEGILTPSAYKMNTPSFHKSWSGKNFWTGRILLNMLRDRQYTGCMVWGKKVRHEIGVHRTVRVDPSQWQIIDNCHEAIVSKELFNKVQELLGGEYTQVQKHTTHGNPLSRKVYCGVCRRAIIKKPTMRPYYLCTTPAAMPDMECCRDKVYLDEILDAIFTAIRIQARYAVEIQEINEFQRSQEVKHIDSIQSELRSLDIMRAKLSEQVQYYYESFVDGKLSREAYITQKSVLTERLKEVSEKTACLQSQINTATTETNGFIKSYCKYTELDELTNEVAAELLDRVTIYPDGRLDIRLNYVDELERLYSELTV